MKLLRWDGSVMRPGGWHIASFVVCLATVAYSTVALRRAHQLGAAVSEARAPTVVAPAPSREPLQCPPSPECVADPPLRCRGLFEVGQSVGRPRQGALYGGARMPAGEGYFIRNPKTAFATQAVVDHLQSAIATSRTKQRRLHNLVIGDMSTELGGKLLGHFSHQSGLDVDLGLYYREKPPEFPEEFVDGNRENLHVRGTFALLEALAQTHDEPDGVAFILLDYDIQRLLYRYAKRSGVSDDKLELIFQFPAGYAAKTGLVRHFPLHRNHMHVRFKCPPADAFCEAKPTPPNAEEVYRHHPDPPDDPTLAKLHRRSRQPNSAAEGDSGPNEPSSTLR